jgi:hypothetical protein
MQPEKNTHELTAEGAFVRSHTELEAPDFSNAMRLTSREWLVVGFLTLAMLLFAPSLWKHVEKFDLEPDYRVPHDLSNDYWLYDRYAGLAAARYDTLLVGDSFIWGEYVTRQETLSHYLNEQAGEQRFANLGLDGVDPLALSGLAEHYAHGVSSKSVILFCNLLWMSSPRRDYQEEEHFDSSHPRLIPQFSRRFLGYKEDFSPRIGVLVEQRQPFDSWTNHLQTAYYSQSDIPTWTLEHPYENPVEPLMHDLPPSDNSLRHLPIPWYKSGITKQDYPWIDLDTSLQWQAFRRTVEILQKRKNQVFVLVGPFNEHMLDPESLKRYQKVKSEIVNWLEQKNVPYLAPPALPSELYGDASHPLAAGYAQLARELKAQVR